MKKLYLVLELTLLLGSVGVMFLFLRSDSPGVPNNIQTQVNFVIFYPKQRQATIQQNTFKYDARLAQLSFITDFAGRHITFAEQSSPDSFSADPSFYPKFIKSLGGYSTFDSVNGRVDLTRPAQVNTETGVMNAKGTLLFAKSDGDLSENNWKLLFNTLSYIQPD